jgi:glycosyltransferase involved in cell wall biosynthesis
MKISVALCTYNGEKFLNEQINSILNQTLKVDEIIVCDDGSNDKTIEILNSYKTDNPSIFKIYENKINLKSVKNFEQAIFLCTGDFIFLSDQDDIWVSNKVEKYIEYFEKHDNIKVLASNGYCLIDRQIILNKYSLWDIPEFLREKKLNYTYFEIISNVSNIVTGATIAFRKTIKNEIIPFPILKNLHHDEWIAYISSYNNQFELLNEKYFYYRIHKNQQVGGVFFEKSEKSKQKKIDVYDYKNLDKSFDILKKRLKKLNQSSKKKFCNKNELIKLQILINKTKEYIIKKYPIKFYLLNSYYKITNKKRF